MRKFGILNRKLNDALSSMGHGDILVITDAGFPLPYESQSATISLDLAVTEDIPDILTILKLINDEFIYEECYVADFMKEYNKDHYENVKKIVKRCEVQIVEQDKIVELAKKAKLIIRTGNFCPWGNVALVSGIKASDWFNKQNIIVPDFYKERVSYVDNDFPRV